MSTTTVADDQTRGVIRDVRGDSVVFAPSGTKYQLHFKCDVVPQSGSRIKGRICAVALRIHKASGGGQFIEPIVGQPRIVQGRLIAVDPEGNRLLLDAGVPIWLQLNGEQFASEFELRSMLNCYVNSGTKLDIAGS